MASAIRVLVVDDSPFMCRAITRIVNEQADLEVVGTARDGAEALERIASLAPDVVTLDVEMPVMDGLATLERIQAGSRVPVVMLSSLTQAGSETTLKALELGAFDFVPKPQSGMMDIFLVAKELAAKIRAAARPARNVRPPAPSAPASAAWAPSAQASILHSTPTAGTAAPARRVSIVLIGISTGGPPALQEVLARLPGDFAIPLVVAQHMPAGFTRALAERLDQLCALRVREATAGDRPEPGSVLVAPAGSHLVFRPSPQGPEIALLDSSDAQTWYKPSVDIMFASAAGIYGARALALVMTGLGNDGTSGAGILKEAGASVWAQDEATCAVYGMPRVVVEAGLADRVLPLGDIAAALTSLRPAPGDTL